MTMQNNQLIELALERVMLDNENAKKRIAILETTLRIVLENASEYAKDQSAKEILEIAKYNLENKNIGLHKEYVQ